MTRKENIRAIIECNFSQTDADIRETAIKNIVKLLQSENEFISSAEDYRLRLIQIFHNTHCEEFISFMVLPTESDLNMLEDMLREHYKDAEPCEDAVSRRAAIEIVRSNIHYGLDKEYEYSRELLEKTIAEINSLPSVTPTRPNAHNNNEDYAECDQFVCSNCGIELQDWHRV